MYTAGVACGTCVWVRVPLVMMPCAWQLVWQMVCEMGRLVWTMTMLTINSLLASAVNHTTKLRTTSPPLLLLTLTLSLVASSLSHTIFPFTSPPTRILDVHIVRR
jgi:hypothetical protein